jgi:4-aminobutyrate aminotransferase-like enzyme
LCVLDELEGGLLAQIGRVGHHVEQRLRKMAAAHESVKTVRGAGLMWGLELHRDAAAIVPAGLARGVIVNRTAETVVRLLPPLVITTDEIDEGLSRLDAALTAFESEGAA